MIGGADKYMAVCRTCYQLPSVKHSLLSTETPIRGGGPAVNGRLLFDFADDDFIN